MFTDLYAVSTQSDRLNMYMRDHTEMRCMHTHDNFPNISYKEEKNVSDDVVAGGRRRGEYEKGVVTSPHGEIAVESESRWTVGIELSLKACRGIRLFKAILRYLLLYYHLLQR